MCTWQSTASSNRSSIVVPAALSTGEIVTSTGPSQLAVSSLLLTLLNIHQPSGIQTCPPSSLFITVLTFDCNDKIPLYDIMVRCTCITNHLATHHCIHVVYYMMQWIQSVSLWPVHLCLQCLGIIKTPTQTGCLHAKSLLNLLQASTRLMFRLWAILLGDRITDGFTRQ